MNGIKDGDNFRQGRVISDSPRVDEILEMLNIETGTAVQQDLRKEEYVESALEAGLAIELEKMHKTSTCYLQPAREIAVRRGESKLVQEYASAHPEVAFKRFTSVAGVADMYIADADGAELIEAKGGSSRHRVREAVAQLLHYAPHSPGSVKRLTALFPLRPAQIDISYLHSLGIDCVFRVTPHKFTRLEAPAVRRRYMLPVWNNTLAEEIGDAG